ncbi:MAG: hypothetical protein HY303_17300 [Candidatus Wallbacteria bacterium]|nr:hypothetical protein [Candidatus Wallbacteria bacterium]
MNHSFVSAMWVAAWLGQVVGAQEAPPVRVLDVRGAATVSLAAGKAATALAAGQGLDAGSTVKLDQGASALLLLEDGKPVQLQGPTQYTVPAKPSAAPAPGRSSLLESLWNRLKSLADSGGLKESAPGRVRGGGPDLLYPIGSIVEEAPTLQWARSDEAKTFLVTVRSVEGKTVASGTVQTCEYGVPAGVLNPGGMYTWEVVPLIHSRPAGVSQGFFELPERAVLDSTARDVAAVRKQLGAAASEPAILLAVGAYLESKELLGAALQAYRKAASKAGAGALGELCRRAAESVQKRQAK